MVYVNNIIEIEFTEELLEEWTKKYFKKHPKSKKRPIQSSKHPSINVWSIMRRPMMNTLKKNWADFVEFCVDYYGYRDLGICHCKCKYIVYKSTLRRSDPDNITPKFIMDGLSAEHSGVIVDDSSDCVEELTLKIEYKKGKQGSKIVFYDCEFDEKLLHETAIKEIAKSKKREETMSTNKIKKNSTKKKVKK